MEVSQSLWKIADIGRSIPQALLARARELRKQQTPTVLSLLRLLVGTRRIL